MLSRTLVARWLAVAGVALALSAALPAARPVHAADHEPALGQPRGTYQPQDGAEDREPKANLPYLFAVFIITWAAFFGYVFVMSQRQKEMRREIEELRSSLAGRERRERPGGAGGPPGEREAPRKEG